MLWVGQGEYMGECSNERTIYKNQSVFFILFSASGIVGNVFGLIMLRTSELRLALYFMMSFFGYASVVLMCCNV